MRLTRVLLAGLLGWLAALAFGPVFGGPPWPGSFATAVTATVLAATAAGAAAASIERLAPALAASCGAIGVIGVAAGVTGAGTRIAAGPAQLVVGALPADPEGPPLGAVAAVAGLAALLSAMPAAYSGNGLLPLLPSLGCLALACGLGAPLGGLPVWYAPAFLAVQAAILCTGRFSGRLPARRLIAVVAVGATAVAATALLGPVVAPSRQPADVRTVTEPPATPHDGVSPLQQYLAYRDGKIPLRLALRSSTPVERVRMATLTRFNGEYWTTGGDFRRAGTRLPPPRIGAPHGISQQVRVERGNLDWLITAGRPERVSVGGLEVDRATGDAMTPALPGNRPLTSYTATAVSNEPAADDLSQDRPVFVGDHLARSLPGRIQTFVEKTVGEERTPAEQLFALRNAFTDRFRYDLSKTAPGGHGYYQIGQLLDTRRGTSEQYASAFAVMAESLGMDARVVMGFLTRDGTVQGADVDAWVEVRYARLGWVPIYPSPSRTSALRTPNTVNSTPQNPPDAFGKLARNHEDEAAASGSGAAQPGPPVHKGASPVGMILGVLVSTALACVLGMAPCLRLLRRLRRRRAPCARQAVLGAWWETADRLREAGYPVVASTTTGDTVRLLPDIDSVRRLARLIDAAAYAPEAPPPGMLRDAWAVAAEIRRDLRSRTPLRRRAQAILDPRPLLSVPRRRGDDGAAKWPGRQRRPLPPGGGAPGPQRAH